MTMKAAESFRLRLRVCTDCGSVGLGGVTSIEPFAGVDVRILNIGPFRVR